MRRRLEQWVTGAGLVGIGVLLLALIWVSWTGLWAAAWVWLSLALVVLVGVDLALIAWLRGPLFGIARGLGDGAFACRVAGGSALEGAVAIRAGDNAVANVIGRELTIHSTEGHRVIGPVTVVSVEVVAVAGLVERKALRFDVHGSSVVLIPLGRFGAVGDGRLHRLRNALQAGWKQ